jgi:hypothetical protein
MVFLEYHFQKLGIEEDFQSTTVDSASNTTYNNLLSTLVLNL